MQLTELLGIEHPIIQAPMAGVQGSALALAVSNAGALGSLPAALLGLKALRSELEVIRAHTQRPYNVNFFCHTRTEPDAQREAAWRAFERDEMGFGSLIVPELAEAASRTGDAALLRATLDWLTERAHVTPTEWARGIEARVRALSSDGGAAESLYREALDRLGRTRLRIELARTHLLYGEWLRREQRRVDAREQLRTAHEMLSTMGVEAFADRAERELLATGETVRKRRVETRGDLTAQEAQIARLARDGLTNPEIGAQLFISPRTVQYHLRKVFLKLGISSRAELQRVLPGDRAVPQL